MKKVYLTILSLTFLIISFGQVSFGLKGGLNLANIKIDASVDKKAILGFHIGGTLQARLSEKFFIQPALLYSMKGFEAPSIYFVDEQHLILNYVNLPILFGYYLTNRATLSLGPEFGYLASAKSKYETASFDQTKNYKRFDAGVDVSFAFKPVKKIGVDLRYNYGLSSLGTVLVRDRENNTTYDAKTAHRVLQLSVFYQFLR